MLRKLCLSLFVLVSPSLSYAGYYLGAGIGPQFADFNKSALIVSPGSFEAKDNTHQAGNGIFGTLFGGYGGAYRRFYLAGEVNGDLSSLNAHSSNSEALHGTISNTNLRMQNSYGLSLLPGYEVLDQTLLYGRIGYANGSLKISTTDSSLQNLNRRISGFRYGAGVKQAFTDHLDGRMEYSNTGYQNTSFRVVDGATTKTTTISPTISEVEFSLVYRFN